MNQITTPKYRLAQACAATFLSLNILAIDLNGSEQAIEPMTPIHSPIQAKDFEHTLDGKSISLLCLRNANGLELLITNYGARVVSLMVPDRDGEFGDIVTGFDRIEDYLEASEPYHGSIVGRYGNRIGKGQFTLNGESYQLDINNGENTLHGGTNGLHTAVWEMEPVSPQAVRLHYVSPHMEENYPGALDITLLYELTDNNAFKITYTATTDRSTVVNLTHHSFFNLAGGGSILDHELQIDAPFYTPIDAGFIPTGEIKSVAGSPMDFQIATKIGERLDENFIDLKNGQGYDHNWVLTKDWPGQVTRAATLFEPVSGRVMEVYTDQPGIQFYGGNFFDGKDPGKGGSPVAYREALALETQHFPDSPNQPHFPSTTLDSDDSYSHLCIYQFSTR